MTYDPNVFGYVDGQPTYSRDEFIYKKRRRGPITDDAELVAFAEKVTSGWYNAGWRRTFTTYYLGDYALDEPLNSMTLKEYNRLKELQKKARDEAEAAEAARCCGNTSRRSAGLTTASRKSTRTKTETSSAS